MNFLIVLLSTSLTFLVATHARAEICRYPDNKVKLSSSARSACLKKISLTTEIFTLLTPQQLADGPEIFKVKSEPTYCEFLPRDWSGGVSLKFFCILTNAQGLYYNTKQEIVPEAKSFNTNEELLGNNGQVLTDANGKKIKGIRLKVKYVSDAGTFQVQERFREVFTEVASTRILWALGLYADSVYQVEKVICKGCDKNPYVIKQMAPIAGSNTFLNAGVEYRLEGKTIERGQDEGWGVEEMDENYNQWSEQGKIDYQLALAARNLLNHHNTRDAKQNTIKCPKAAQNPETLECTKPIALYDDVGSTFGAPGSFGGAPRGEWSKFSKHRVFASGCTFKIGGTVNTLTKAGQQEFLKRAVNLSPDHVRAIVQSARFDIMDSSFTGENAIRQWSEKINSLVNEIKTANCR
ncbi:MAG: hypothetical protein AB7F59_11950 [Bdellovibrionales bacterium]